MSDYILGIDLGTTNSVAAIVRDGRPEIVMVDGRPLLASVVGLSPEGELLVGEPARNQWVMVPERTVRSIKRQMGQSTSVLMANKGYRPQEISAFLLRALREAAKAATGENIERAVITVPAYFNEVQRQATIEAGAIAGLTVERIINEPTAAALAYGLGSEDDVRVLVFDLGGGTFDVSVIEMANGVIDVRATAGDNVLGGDDFDQLLAVRLADGLLEEHEIDVQADHRAWARLLRAAEEAKIALSGAPYASVSLEYLAEKDDGTPVHLDKEIRREEFEELIMSSLERTVELVGQALDDAQLGPTDIDLVLLVGGSTRIPLVGELLRECLGQVPQGVVDPDLAVALGAAVQGGIIAGEAIDAVLVDVTPFTLGIATAEFTITGRLRSDRYAPLIQRNTAVPVERSEEFSTIYPQQDVIDVKVYQGEDPVASKNVLLGDFRVEDLQPNEPDGTTTVTIHFRLDVNGILHVTVMDREHGRQVRHELKASRQRLSAEEIVRSQSKLADTGLTLLAQDLDPGVSAVAGRAEAVLDRPDLPADTAARLSGLLADLRHAARDGDEEAVERASDALIDGLVEVEDS